MLTLYRAALRLRRAEPALAGTAGLAWLPSSERRAVLPAR